MLSTKRDEAQSAGATVLITQLPLGQGAGEFSSKPGWPAWLAVILLVADAAVWAITESLPLTLFVGAAMAQTAWLWASQRVPSLLNVLGFATFVTSAVVWLLTGSLPVELAWACVAAQVVWVKSAHRKDRRTVAGVALIGLAPVRGSTQTSR